MDNDQLFTQVLSFFSSIHSKTFEFTKDVELAEVTKIQYSILELLVFEPYKTPSEINACLHLSMPNTSRELSKLEQKGLIVKVNDELDRRKVYITLSEAGQSVMNHALGQIKAKFLESISGASEQDLNDISRAIQVLQSKLL